MPNAFTEIQPVRQPIDTFVPLPLELMMKAGAMKQEQINNSKSLLDHDLDEFSKLGNMSVNLIGYGPNGGTQDLVYDDLEKQKQFVISKIKTEREELAAGLASGKLSDYDFNRLSKKHISDAMNQYNQLAGYKEEIDGIKKYNDELRKNKEFALDKSYGTDALSYNTNWYNAAKNGYLYPFAGVGVADAFDIEKDVLTPMAEHWTKDGSGESRKDLKDLDGYIKTNNWEGITKTRVYNYAKQAFESPTSKVKQYSVLNIKHFLRNNNLTGQETSLNGQPITITDEKGNIKNVTLSEYLMNEQKQSFINRAVDRIAGEVYKEDLKADEIWRDAHKEKLDLDKFTVTSHYNNPDTENAINLYGNVNPIDLLQKGTSYINAKLAGLDFDNLVQYKDGNLQVDWSQLDGKPGNINKFFKNIGLTSEIASNIDYSDENKVLDQIFNIGRSREWLTPEIVNKKREELEAIKAQKKYVDHKKKEDDVEEQLKKWGAEQVIRNLVYQKVNAQQLISLDPKIHVGKVINDFTSENSLDKKQNQSTQFNGENKNNAKMEIDFGTSEPTIKLTNSKGESANYPISEPTMKKELSEIQQVPLANNNAMYKGDRLKAEQITNAKNKISQMSTENKMGFADKDLVPTSIVNEKAGDHAIYSYEDRNNPGKIYIRIEDTSTKPSTYKLITEGDFIAIQTRRLQKNKLTRYIEE